MSCNAVLCAWWLGGGTKYRETYIERPCWDSFLIPIYAGCGLRPNCRHRWPSRPQAGSYVGRTRRFVGACLRATRRLHDEDRPRGNRPNAKAVCGDTSGSAPFIFSIHDDNASLLHQPAQGGTRWRFRLFGGDDGAAHSGRRVLAVVLLGCMAQWRIALAGIRPGVSNVRLRARSLGLWLAPPTRYPPHRRKVRRKAKAHRPQ
jgi:hypothetical protein